MGAVSFKSSQRLKTLSVSSTLEGATGAAVAFASSFGPMCSSALLTNRGMSSKRSCHLPSCGTVEAFISARNALTAAPPSIPDFTIFAAKSRNESCRFRPARILS
jgi:hypothetical protein